MKRANSHSQELNNSQLKKQTSQTENSLAEVDELSEILSQTSVNQDLHNDLKTIEDNDKSYDTDNIETGEVNDEENEVKKNGENEDSDTGVVYDDEDVFINTINIEAIVKKVKFQKLNEKCLVRLDTEVKSLQEMERLLEKTRKNLEVAKLKNKPYYDKIVENIQKEFDFAESNLQKNNSEKELLIQEKQTLEKSLINLYQR